MTTRYIAPITQAFDDAGVSLAGAKLYFYATGTSTPLDTYSDSALSIPNTNPVVANAAGRFGPIFLQAAVYKVVFTDSADVIIWTADPLDGTADTLRLDLASTLAGKGSALVGLEGKTGKTVSDFFSTDAGEGSALIGLEGKAGKTVSSFFLDTAGNGASLIGLTGKTGKTVASLVTFGSGNTTDLIPMATGVTSSILSASASVTTGLKALSDEIESDQSSNPYLRNRSFEVYSGGVLAFWTASALSGATIAGTTVHTTKIHGHNAAQYVGSGGVNAGLFTSDPVLVRPGEIWLAGAHIQRRTGTCDTFRIKVLFTSQTGTDLTPVVVWDKLAGSPTQPDFPTGGTWGSRFGAVTIPATAEYARLQFEFSDSGGTPDILIDNCKLEPYRPATGIPDAVSYSTSTSLTTRTITQPTDPNSHPVFASGMECLDPGGAATLVALYDWMDGAWRSRTVATVKSGVFLDPAGRFRTDHSAGGETVADAPLIFMP